MENHNNHQQTEQRPEPTQALVPQQPQQHQPTGMVPSWQLPPQPPQHIVVTSAAPQRAQPVARYTAIGHETLSKV